MGQILDSIMKSVAYIDKEGNPITYETFIADLEKSRSGYYMNTPENRKLGRVGVPYGQKAEVHEEERSRILKIVDEGKTNTKTTFDEYSENDKPTPERFKKVWEPVIRKYAKQQLIESKPKAYLLLGGGGSGKGYTLRKLKEEFSSLGKTPTINVDDIKKEIPGYFEMQKVDPKSAANYVHNESSKIGEIVRDQYQKHKSSYIADQVFGNYEKAKRDILQLKKLGYEIHLIGIATDLDIAMQRAKERGDRVGRYVPEDNLRKAHKGASNTFDMVVKELSSVVDDIRLYDGNGNDGKMVYDNGEIKNPILYKKFIDKKNVF